MLSVRTESNGPVTTVIIDRPQLRNAVDRETASALLHAFEAFDADDTARVAVLWGAGGNFCAGADLKAIAGGQPNRLDPDGAGPMGPSRMILSKPVIAAISGYAVAGGLELALWCDLRVADETATMGVFCRRWGVPLIDGGTERLPRLIGLSRALDLILTGRAVDSAEALEMGLINRVVRTGTCRAAAEALAAELARFPQACMLADRVSAYEAFDGPLPTRIRSAFERAMPVVTEAARGASLFSDGRGRGGRFDDFDHEW